MTTLPLKLESIRHGDLQMWSIKGKTLIRMCIRKIELMKRVGERGEQTIGIEMNRNTVGM